MLADEQQPLLMAWSSTTISRGMPDDQRIFASIRGRAVSFKSSLISRTRSNDLSLLAKRDSLAALRADVISRALTQVVFLGEGGVIAGLSAPLLLEDYGTLLLHRDGLRAK
jgi:hypothetical protein